MARICCLNGSGTMFGFFRSGALSVTLAVVAAGIVITGAIGGAGSFGDSPRARMEAGMGTGWVSGGARRPAPARTALVLPAGACSWPCTGAAEVPFRANWDNSGGAGDEAAIDT